MTEFWYQLTQWQETRTELDQVVAQLKKNGDKEGEYFIYTKDDRGFWSIFTKGERLSKADACGDPQQKKGDKSKNLEGVYLYNERTDSNDEQAVATMDEDSE